MNSFEDLSSYFRNVDRSNERPLPTRRMQIIREIISNYNENVRLNNQQMMEYHQNMREILDMVRSFPDLQTRASSIPTPTSNRNTNRLHTTNIYPELSTLLYLLSNSIDYTTAERQTPTRTESLSRAQIQTATRNIHYTTDLSYNICPISLEDFVENEEICQIKHCGHIFREEALRNWFRRNVRCPVCRYDIRNYINTNRNHMNSNNDVSGNTRTNVVGSQYNTTESDSEDSESDEIIEPTNNSATIPPIPDTLSQNLTNILVDYINNHIGPNMQDLSGSFTHTFELPIFYYSDNSGYYFDSSNNT
jgi:hypothetical protein